MIETGSPGALVFTLGRSDDGLHSAGDGGLATAFPHLRNDDFFDDLFASRVRQYSLQTVSGVNAQFPVCGKYEKYGSVVFASRTGLPRFEDPLGIVDHFRILGDCLEDRDDELRRRLALVGLESRIERLIDRWTQPARVIENIMRLRTGWHGTAHCGD